MVQAPMYIAPETADLIKDKAVLDEVIADFTELKQKGSDLVGSCPHCHAKKFSVNPKKKVYKCWSGCEKSGKDAVKFLTDIIGKTYPEALHYLADKI